ncbi:hypothetical protein GWC77_27890 [Paraburkholderia sp. NMBU_R16]|uniref:hypothetical protein n=1 Tax=Paraburkholderia sp. NMBU_R16 TaxID=2698676 RepID=UPI001563B937|nr:hypothetical protein [Paraburkholderia sp. NMBU_R16]NRO99669.1 hypothetical protein [Paraburkholderia sp. NMBU_R16]
MDAQARLKLNETLAAMSALAAAQDEAKAFFAAQIPSTSRQTLDITDSAQILSVGQAQIGRLGSEDARRYIETIGVGPCIAVSVYDPVNKTAALTHLDGLTDMPSTLTALFHEMGPHCEVRVFGADRSSFEQLRELRVQLAQRGVRPVEWDVLNSVKSIVLDRDTGQVSNVRPRERSGSLTFAASAMADIFRRSQAKQPAKWTF